VGYLNIFLGSVYALSQLGILLFVYPKLFKMYETMDVDLPRETTFSPVISAFSAIIFLCVVFLGVRILTKPSEKVFRWGVVSLVLLLTISGLFFSASVLSTVTALYNITSSL
jgi:type II secretory pathway component PulF